MNKKNVLTILGVMTLLLVSIALYQLNTTPVIKSELIKSAKQTSQQRKEALDKTVKSIEKLAQTDPQKAKSETEELLDSLPVKAKRYYDLGFKAGVEDITFYGKVLDQDGEPVVGASVQFEAGGRYLASGSGRGVLKTDINGRFHLKAEGGSLIIGPIKHPSIDAFRYLASDGQVEEGSVGFFGYQHTKGGNDLVWTDHTDEDNPYVFTVWRRKAGQVASKLYSVDTPTRYNCQGDTYTLDFTQERTKRITKGETDGQLRVRFTCKKKEHHRDEGDWSVELEAINGGIQETQDVYLNEAPEAGYEPLFHLAMQYGDPNYQRIVTKRFYFMAGNDEYYGSLEAKFIPYIYDEPKIDMKFKLNPKGSRVLVSNK